ncbi:MAG: ATP-binding protein [Pseudomonadota bacterium]
MVQSRGISAGHDLRLYKSLSRDSAFEILARVSFLSFAGISSGLAFEDPLFFVLTGVYLLLQALFLVLLHLGPDIARRRHAVAVYGVGFGVMATVMGAAVYTWDSYPGLGSLLSLMLVFAAMMSSIGTRIREPVAPLIERVTISTTVLILIFVVITGEARSDMELGMQTVSLLGGLAYYLIAFRSVRQAHLELNRQQEKALQSARLQAIGQITGGVAHDFNNLLAVIRGNLELRKELLNSGAVPDEAEALLVEVEKATDRAVDTTRDLLSYTGRMPLKAEYVDVAAHIADMMPILRRAVPAAVNLSFAADEALPQVRLDARELGTVLLNLVLNGCDAIAGKGGDIVITVMRNDADAVVVSVRDTGTGMTPETLAHATEPYFTTKPAGTGSGLGLAMAQGFAVQSGGALEISSEVGQGTVVTLTFPAANGVALKSVS